MKMNIALEWKTAPTEGQLEILRGKLITGKIARGRGSFSHDCFSCPDAGPCRLELDIDAENLEPGMNPTIVYVRAAVNPFTFFLRDVRPDFPILIPDYGVAVTVAEDQRCYEEIQRAVRDKRLLTNLQRIDVESEESFEAAAARTRELHHPIWLGVSRDVRIFETGLRQPMVYTDWIRPRFHGHGYFWPESEYTSCRYGFVAGRGWNCTERVTRRLDEGVLPILHVERIDDDVRYEQTAFVILEKTPLTPEGLRGTHALVGDGLSVCHAFTDEQQKLFELLRDEELNRDEETVLCYRVVAVNTAGVPRYAFFKAVFPHQPFGDPMAHQFDGKNGFGMHENSDLVFGISKLNGKPMSQEEIAVLLAPGATATFEFLLPHRPIPQERAKALSTRNVPDRLDECRGFWNGKLAKAARITVPEKRIDEMLRAGLIHLDLISYGREPNGPLSVTDGAYGPVSAEVWLNIHYFDSMGWHDVARRGLTYFLDKQQEDGFMQNFTGYMLDTGCVLFALGEHYRYTRDDDWVKQIASKVLKSCEFLLNWRARNLEDDLRGRGYGMMEGQVADPKDHERIFMLNAYACAGLARAAEMLEKTDPFQSSRLRAEAESFKADLRAAFFESLARGPVVPLGNGTWSPTAAPWVGPHGPKCLFTDGGNWWTHGSMTARDDIIGPIHLASLGILDPGEQATGLMLDYLSELMFSCNVAASQPYYSQHPLLHLRRGECKRFLKAYYNTMASMADREIYSFWEHFYHESPHKTHEEAEFLMQTRWMLYLEDGETLKLLQGAPRAWFENGKRIELNKVASYFGLLSLEVESKVDQGLIETKIVCDPNRKPKRVEIRLPHPEKKKAVSVEGGTYDADRETVLIEGVEGCAKICLRFM